ncbi:MAG: hypothetical protein ACLSF2_02905 [Butyricicoccus sp.]
MTRPMQAAFTGWSSRWQAAVAAGADGLMIEVHNDPAHALSDGAQSLTYDSFHHTMNALRVLQRQLTEKSDTHYNVR